MSRLTPWRTAAVGTMGAQNLPKEQQGHLLCISFSIAQQRGGVPLQEARGDVLELIGEVLLGQPSR